MLSNDNDLAENSDVLRVHVDDVDDADPLTSSNLDCNYYTERACHDFFNFSDKKTLNVLHLNARSLKANFVGLENLLSVINGTLSAIAVTETWLNDNVADTYFLPGYNFISKSRASTGGGVGIFLSDEFSFTVRDDLCRMTTYIECVFV